jgi:hypothetical protein
MASLQEEEKEREMLVKSLSELTAINPDDLVRKEQLGNELSFESGLPVFRRTLDLFKELNDINLEIIPQNFLNSIKSQINDAIEKFKKIREFTSNQSNPASVRNQLISNLQEQYGSYFGTLHTILSYAHKKETDLTRLENDAKEILKFMNESKDYLATEQRKALDETNSVLDKVRQAAAEVGVAQHATHFETEAKYHLKQSFWWMISTIVLASLTIGWGITSFFLFPHSSEVNGVLPAIISKLIILVGLYYGLVWSAKNYKSNRHNFVVNTHRQNSLKTFETFVKAAGSDNETKNAILLQATKTIFGYQPSGYVSNEADSDNTPNYFEIIKNFYKSN